MSVVMFWVKLDFKNTLNGIVIDLFKVTAEYNALSTAPPHTYTIKSRSYPLRFKNTVVTNLPSSGLWGSQKHQGSLMTLFRVP